MSNWAPHTYRQNGEREGCAPELLDVLVREGQRLDSLKLPVVFTLKHLATICGVEYSFLRKVVSRKIHPYRIFKLRKRSGGYRHITVPHPQLLTVQQWIHKNILVKQSVHPISAAYGIGCTPITNANRHVGARCLVKIDLERFFESISERQVYHAFRTIGYPALLAFEFTRITTRVSERARHYRSRRWRAHSESKIKAYGNRHVGHLPQGAPSSPVLANLVCLQLDKSLAEIAAQDGYVVSRYADDIVFSSQVFNRENAIALIEKVDCYLRAFSFRRNAVKTQIVSPGARRIVTGLLVDQAKPTLPKKFRDDLRCHLFYADKYGIAAHCQKRKFNSLLGFRNFLRGMIAYANQVDQVFGAECQEKYSMLRWGMLDEL